VYANEPDASALQDPNPMELTMCPACLTTLILVAGGTGSAGGLAALAAKKLLDRRKPPPRTSRPAERTT